MASKNSKPNYRWFAEDHWKRPPSRNQGEETVDKRVGRVSRPHFARRSEHREGERRRGSLAVIFDDSNMHGFFEINVEAPHVSTA